MLLKLKKCSSILVSLVKGRSFDFTSERGIERQTGWVLISFLISFFFFFTPQILALNSDPVVVDEANWSYPAVSGKDQNYVGSDINAVETRVYEKTINISESFGPEILSQEEGKDPVYKSQDINKIKQDINTREINTPWYRQNFLHFAQPLVNPLASPESIKSTFTSYSSSTNASRPSLSASVQRCLISNQISDIATFIGGGNSICIDREVDTAKGKIRIGEIISALIKGGLGNLYYSDTSCPADQKPKAFPGAVLSALQKQSGTYKYSLSIKEYQQLYLYGIEPVCTNSLAQSVRHCDLNDKGEKLNCKDEVRSEPLAAAGANEEIYRSYLPSKVKNVSKDYGDTNKNPSIEDKPNPLSWLAQFFKDFFSGILKDNVTFDGPQSVTTKVDERQATALEANETLINNFIPASSQKPPAPASGTNGVTLDPGHNNNQLENQFFDLTRPASWKKKTLSP